MNNFCYIHIPFCSSKCKYCRFASFGILDSIKVDYYVKHLITEIKNKKTDFNNLKSVYFGGGTPSILSAKQFNDIFNALNSKFKLEKNTEINIEATPITVTKENLLSWKKIGINRISIGVQTLNNESLKEIGRGEKGDIINALDVVKEVGFDNISIDFIIGLPFIKKGELKKDIDFILSNYNFIKHVSVYMLEEYYDVGDTESSKFENITYPNKWESIGLNEEDYLSEYMDIKNFLNIRGFNSYEISNFSKKGYECKHNQAYWNHSNILAFGLGAHGLEDNLRYSNSENFIEYYKGENVFYDKLNKEDVFLEKVMFELRTSGLTEVNYNKLDSNKINELINDGYLIKKDDLIILSDKGVLVHDLILKEII